MTDDQKPSASDTPAPALTRDARASLAVDLAADQLLTAAMGLARAGRTKLPAPTLSKLLRAVTLIEKASS